MAERLANFDIYEHGEKVDTIERTQSELLVTMPYGIGDVVYIGLAAVDQAVRSKPDVAGRIDVLCNATQAELFSCDPRINEVIVADRGIFPTQDKKTWGKAFFVPPEGKELLHALQQRQYEAVFPGNAAFGFVHQLHARVMYPNLLDILQDYLQLRQCKDAPAIRRVRGIIGKVLGGAGVSYQNDTVIPLYLPPGVLAEAAGAVTQTKSGLKGGDAKLLVVAPDTASGVTRPPTELLAEGVGGVMERRQDLVVTILPSYSDELASSRLAKRLIQRFPGRVSQLDAQPRPSLLFTTAFIDQADVLVTGDTGIMHLAAATKVLPDCPAGCEPSPKNATKIIAIFGGTNPGLYGYGGRTEIIGRARKEQRAIRPGLLKEGYDPKGKAFFDHVSPGELRDALLRGVGSAGLSRSPLGITPPSKEKVRNS